MARSRITVDQALLAALPVNSRVLLAVSGGLDSMALLHGALTVREKLSLHIEVAHFNHNIRPDSRLDGELVAKRCSKAQMQLHLQSGTPPADRNLEGWGRVARYTFFEQIRSKYNLDWILTAHHADDLAETLLMRLIANRELRTIEARDTRRNLLRPFLQLSKSQLLSYAEKHSIEYREDSTNSDSSFLRNRIRNELVPLLERDYEPAVVHNLVERAASLAQDFEVIDGSVQSALASLGRPDFSDPQWCTRLSGVASSVPVAVGWRLVELLLLSTLGFKLGRVSSQRALAVVAKQERATDLPGGWNICWKGRRIQLKGTSGDK